MKLYECELTPGGYGQVRYHPLYLANETNTDLERCWRSFRSLCVGVAKLTTEELDSDSVALNFCYSLRTRPLDFREICGDALRMAKASAIQEVHRIIVAALEQAHALVFISDNKRIGQSIADFRRAMEDDQRKFHSLPLPKKLSRFSVKPIFKPYLNFVDAVTKARNALEHRRGVLGRQDCNTPGKLRIALKVPEALRVIRRQGSQSDAGRTARSQFVDDVLVFREGGSVMFEPVAILGVMLTANFALKGIVDWIYDINGVTDTEKQGWILKQFRAESGGPD